MNEQGIRVRYMDSDIDTLERIETGAISGSARPMCRSVSTSCARASTSRCALVAILYADKEGFLRSETSLIQTIGRAARTSMAGSFGTPTRSSDR